MKWVSSVHPWLEGLQQIVLFVDYDVEAKEQEASETSSSKKFVKLRHWGSCSSLWRLKIDGVAHNFTPTNHNAHRYLLQSTNKKAAKKVWHILLNRKVTLDGLKMSSPMLLVCNWSLKKNHPDSWNEEASQMRGQTSSRHTAKVQQPLTDYCYWTCSKDRAVDHPAVSAVGRSCQCWPSMSAAAAGGVERLSGWC